MLVYQRVPIKWIEMAKCQWPDQQIAGSHGTYDDTSDEWLDFLGYRSYFRDTPWNVEKPVSIGQTPASSVSTGWEQVSPNGLMDCDSPIYKG